METQKDAGPPAVPPPEESGKAQEDAAAVDGSIAPAEEEKVEQTPDPSTMTSEANRVAKAVIDRWGEPDRRGRTNRWWGELFFQSGWRDLENKLTMPEWEEYLRTCSVMGLEKADEIRIFRKMLSLINRHGDDGHGDRPAEMSRIVYWFQHADNCPTPRAANTPELLAAARHQMAKWSKTQPAPPAPTAAPEERLADASNADASNADASDTDASNTDAAKRRKLDNDKDCSE